MRRPQVLNSESVPNDQPLITIFTRRWGWGGVTIGICTSLNVLAYISIQITVELLPILSPPVLVETYF